MYVCPHHSVSIFSLVVVVVVIVVSHLYSNQEGMACVVLTIDDLCQDSSITKNRIEVNSIVTTRLIIPLVVYTTTKLRIGFHRLYI